MSSGQSTWDAQQYYYLPDVSVEPTVLAIL
jgi:hypothetical protein